jgi:RNA polymerase sigma factor (sigma-70 family)
VIAALQALRGRHPGAQVILVESESDARVIRECLQSIERTSLGTPGARRTRAKAAADRIADILIRHQELPESNDDKAITADRPSQLPVAERSPAVPTSLPALRPARGGDSLPRAGAAAASVDVALLVRRAAGGDRRAWESLVEQYARLIWSITVEFKLTESDAADVAQTTWLRLLEHIDRVDPDRLGSWLAATARNECLRSLAARKRSVLAHDEEEVLFGMDVSGPEVDERVLADERDQVVRDALSRLPRRWQRLLEMLMADPPASYAEISAGLELPPESIGLTGRRSLARLREQLQASGADTAGHLAPYTPGDSGSYRAWTVVRNLVRAQCG